MNKETSVSLNSEISSSSLNDFLVDCIQDIKGKNIVKLDLNNLDVRPTDFFIICEGESTTQVRAIANNIYKRCKQELGERPNHIEGKDHSRWILVDFVDTIVHIFYPEARALYQLEDLWSDAERKDYEDL